MTDKHYNPAIAARLRTLVDGRQWVLLIQYLDGLSHSHFRTAGYMLGEQFMQQLPDEDFWSLSSQLVRYNRKAFLVTILKSWENGYTAFGTKAMQHSDNAHTRLLAPLLQFLDTFDASPEDVRKTLNVVLPVVDSPSDIESILNTLHVTVVKQRIQALLQSITSATAFVILRTLRQVEDDRAYLVRCTCYLMKLGGNLPFNLASLLCAYFGLYEVKGTFSLRLQPFELARLEKDYVAFRKAMSL